MAEPISGQAPDFEVFVPGVPRPQGSKTRNGKGRGMRESSKYVKGWRNEIAAYAHSVWAYSRSPSPAPMDGPLMLGVEFLFPRPAKHSKHVWCGKCRVSGKRRGSCDDCILASVLKPTAPRYMTSKPDKDKLVRAVGDALVMANVVEDDSLFVRDHESGCKRYANPGEQPGARIRIWRL